MKSGRVFKMPSKQNLDSSVYFIKIALLATTTSAILFILLGLTFDTGNYLTSLDINKTIAMVILIALCLLRLSRLLSEKTGWPRFWPKLPVRSRLDSLLDLGYIVFLTILVFFV